jgi:anaerobic magnesium-protoporphyrin IX monomethyl ester cyclase
VLTNSVAINKNKIILFNPRSATHNHRLPLSIVQVGASVFGKEDFVIIDGNLEEDEWQKLNAYLETGEFAYFACTVMPGPQLKNAIRLTKAVREKFPAMIIIWGGYFSSNHFRVAMEAGLIDYIIRGPGDEAFPKLIQYLKKGMTDRLSEIGNLVYYLPDRQLAVNQMNPVPVQDSLPALPLDHLDQFYPIEKYIARTFIGRRTLSYHSSIGCPHSCSFCGVATVYNSTWKGKSAQKMADEIMHYKSKYNIDAIEFHDSNFFCSHSRTIEFCKLMKGQDIKWWAEGRIDTMNNYSDEELQLISDSGCCLVFMGAESSNDSLLGYMNKGKSLHVNDTVEVVRRFGQFGIIPQLSFVLGIPDRSPGKMMEQIHADIRFIRRLKKLNPSTELILYLFSPVLSEGSELFKAVTDHGFIFPSSLDEWMTTKWEDMELRRGNGIPWLQPSMVRFIRNFEVVLASAYPGISNFHINSLAKGLLKIPGKFRYKLRWYSFPYEIKAILRLLSYQRPEKEGFYTK